MTVRDLAPQRRSAPTKKPVGRNWSEHKPDLREDFNSSCGYCGSFDGFRHTYFEVDHFVPKSLFEKNNNISYCQYDNLVYSCKFCNNNKSAKWPSNDETIAVLNNQGFIDPCDPLYENHFKRTEKGGIIGVSELGKWMTTKAFKFDKRDYAIKLLWNLNQIRKNIDALVYILNKEKNKVKYKKIKLKAEQYSLTYFTYHKQLMKHYNG